MTCICVFRVHSDRTVGGKYAIVLRTHRPADNSATEASMVSHTSSWRVRHPHSAYKPEEMCVEIIEMLLSSSGGSWLQYPLVACAMLSGVCRIAY